MSSDSRRRQPRTLFGPAPAPAQAPAPESGGAAPAAPPQPAAPEPIHPPPTAGIPLEARSRRGPRLDLGGGSTTAEPSPSIRPTPPRPIAIPTAAPTAETAIVPEIEVPPTPPLFSGRGRAWLLAALVVLVACAFGARPVYRALKTKRAHALDAQAATLMSQKKWREALRVAEAAYQLSPQDEQTLRIAAHLCRALGGREAIGFWQNLVQTGHATAQDRRDLCEFALRRKEVGVAKEHILWLLANEPKSLANFRLAVEYYFTTGDQAKARDYCRRALELTPADLSLELLLAQLLARSPNVADQIKARELLRELGASTGGVGLDALDMLARMGSRLSRDDAEWTADRLSHHPLAKTEHQLRALELRLWWHPEQRQAMLEGAVKSYGHEADLLALGRWLNRQREYLQTLDLIPLVASLRTQDLFLVRMDALASLNRWSEIKQILDGQKCPLEPVLSDLFKARTAKELGEADQAAMYWRRVHLEATDRPAAWLYIAQYAERIGDIPEATKAWRRLTQDPNLGRAAYDALIRLGEREGNTQSLREVMRDLVKLEPNDPAPANDLAYLDSLLNENLTAARETGRRLLDQHPNYLAYRTTLALACLRQGDLRTASALYEGLDLDWGAVLPGWQAVRVAVLGANGKTNLAHVAASRIPVASLKPEERALVEPYL